MKIVTVEEMRRIEASADEGGHSYAAMMEQAGRAVAEAILARWEVRDRRAMVVVGPGNNGGDGLVAARHLVEAGARVVCYLIKPRDPAEDENLRLVQELGLSIILAAEDGGGRKLRRLAREAHLVVDALLGTGTQLPLRGMVAEVLGVVGQVLAGRRRPSSGRLTSLSHLDPSMLSSDDRPFVVAVDGPSGLEYDSGALGAAAIPADLTVTFAYPKLGHFLFPGAEALGELVVADIGIPPKLAADVALEVATPAMVREWLPPRPGDAHKGTFGKAMIVAGSVNYTGAAYLAGAAATRAGAGLVTLALPAAIHSAVAGRLAEATYLLLPQNMGVIAPQAVGVLADGLETYSALLLGPGLGHERETVTFITNLLGGRSRKGPVGFGGGKGAGDSVSSLPPLVIDADGLNGLVAMEDWPRHLPPETILTPHPGEMARLMGGSVGEVQADRIAVARSQAAAWEQVIVLKGAHTVVAAPNGRVVVEPFVNPGLATAGTGDVLAGTIVALRAQGLGAFEAAVAGAYLHGLAGELARTEVGAVGMVAGDVLANLSSACERVVKL